MSAFAIDTSTDTLGALLCANAGEVNTNEAYATPATENNDFKVDDPAFFFSPYNWRISNGTTAESNNPGAYFKTCFTGASCTLLVDTSHQTGLSSAEYPAVQWSIDGLAVNRSQLVAGQTTLSLASGLSSGSHTIELYLCGAWWLADRWINPISSIRVTGLRLAEGESLSSSTIYPGRMIVYADSNGEGYESLALGVSVANQDATVAFPLLIARALECEVGVVSFAGQGYTQPGGGNVPALSSAWDKYSDGSSRLSGGLFSPSPDWIVSTHGQNDGGSPQTTVASLLSAWRTAAPHAKIAICSPSNLNHASSLSAAVTAFGDAKCKWCTTGETIYIVNGQYVNANHLSGLRGHPRYASALSTAIGLQFHD
jgi:hypothetical protein